MNPFKAIFGTLKGLVEKAFGLAKQSGLTERAVSDALTFVKVAGDKFTDNAERREWVVKMLVSKGLPESIARLAVELAVRLWKAETQPKA
jgi:hypothetical protein